MVYVVQMKKNYHYVNVNADRDFQVSDMKIYVLYKLVILHQMDKGRFFLLKELK